MTTTMIVLLLRRRGQREARRRGATVTTSSSSTTQRRRLERTTSHNNTTAALLSLPLASCRRRQRPTTRQKHSTALVACASCRSNVGNRTFWSRSAHRLPSSPSRQGRSVISSGSSSVGINRPRNQPLHGTAAAAHSSVTTMDFTHGSQRAPPPSSEATAAPSVLFDAVRKPPFGALRTLFVASAIPMVGFGFMVRSVSVDRVIMVLARPPLLLLASCK